MARGGQLGTSQPQDDAQLFSTDKKALLEFVRCDIPRDSSTQNPLIVLAKGCLQMGSPCLGAPRSTGGAKSQHRVCHGHPQPSQSRVSWASLTWGTWGMKSPQGHPCRTVSNLQQPNFFPKHKIIQLFHVQVWNSQVWSVIQKLGCIISCHCSFCLHSDSASPHLTSGNFRDQLKTSTKFSTFLRGKFRIKLKVLIEQVGKL